MTWVGSLDWIVLWGGSGAFFMNDIQALDPTTAEWVTLSPQNYCAGNVSFFPNGSDENGVVWDSVSDRLWIYNGGSGYRCLQSAGHTAASGTTSTAIVDPTLSATTTNFYRDWKVRANGVVVYVNAYSPTTKTLTLSAPLAVTAGSYYELFADTGGGTWSYDFSTHAFSKLEPRPWGYNGFIPPGRLSPGFAGDGAKAFLFGGVDYDNATYKLDFTSGAYSIAIAQGSSASPSARGQIQNQFVYDSVRNQYVLFGGRCFDPARCTYQASLDDTWLYDPVANRWTQVATTVRPPGRNQGQMYFDQAKGVVVLYGGANGSVLNDLWTFDPATLAWTQQAVPAVNPGGVYLGQVAYAPTTGCGYIVYGSMPGGSATGRTWRLCLTPTGANTPPIASFTATPSTAAVGSPIALSASGSSDPGGSIVGYAWNFGDGTTGSGVTTSKSYASAGTYTITLTVTDNGGLTASTTRNVTITAGNQAPVANLSVSPSSTTTGTPITFSGTGSTDPDGTIVGYAWDFGDGTTGSGVTVTKSYAAAGNYTARLTVTDNGGLTGSKTAVVTITSSTASNVALASAGGVASASSIYSSGNFAPANIINGERAGANWGNGGGWADNTPNAFPDWVQINFNGQKTIDRVVVYSVQDNYLSPVEPTDTMTFTQYGLTSLSVAAWNGSTWVTLASVTGNNLVKRTMTFTPVTTDRIRVTVNGALATWSRITEVEAFGVASTLPPSTTTLGSAPNPSNVGDTVAFTATVSGTAPAGTVAFSDSGTTISGCGAVATTGSGNTVTAVCNTASLAAGTHNVTAAYGGNSGNAPSVSSPLSQVVNGGGSTGTNVALASAGGVASASSIYSSGNFAPANIINGERAGANWGNGGGWADNTPNAFPDWVQINFNGPKTIQRIVVYSVQDNYLSPVEPTDTMTFTQYGLTNFSVAVWNGSAWLTAATVTGNNLVKRTITFAPLTTDRIRVNVSAALATWSRITEVEAWDQ